MSSDETPRQAPPAIRVENLTKGYRIYERPGDRLKEFIYPKVARWFGRQARSFGTDFLALDGISFTVARGETVGIIGRNGSGKSTLLQVICGTLTPTAGKVEINGRIAALLELGAGFDPEFTGRENVMMNAAILGLSREETLARMDSILAFADIGDFIDQPVKTYSSGMYVRLAFAVIAHVDADILVIDEALAVGDAFFVQKCMRFLRRFMQHGTVLFVSHDTSAVLSLCQRAIWLDHGKIAAEGEAKKVADAYLAALFGQGGQGGQTTEPAEEPPAAAAEPLPDLVPRDMRQDWINASPYRNDLEIFAFDPQAEGFGQGGATITDVRLEDENGHPLNWIVGGEKVTLTLTARVGPAPLARPILGFFVRDRLGQNLFGDNTFLTHPTLLRPAPPGGRIRARFTFRMPILPRGDYSINVAIAEGTQHDHVHHHWLHDALMIKSHSSSESHGLVGIPMQQIQLEIPTDDEQ